MHTSLKWLVLASVVNLVGNVLGTILALQNNLISDLGGSFHGQNVLQDFLGTTGTALSAPLPFMLIQLVFTLLVLRAGRFRIIGVGGLIFFGLFYTIAQLLEKIVLRVWNPSGFDLAQAMVLLINVGSAIAMLVLGIWAWRSMRSPAPSV